MEHVAQIVWSTGCLNLLEIAKELGQDLKIVRVYCERKKDALITAFEVECHKTSKSYSVG